MPPTVDQRLKDLTTGISDLTAGVADLRKELARVTEEQANSVKGVRDMVASIADQMAGVSERIRKLEERMATLAVGLRAPKPAERPAPQPSIALGDLAQHLSDSVASFNQQTKDSPSPIVIENLEVELKTGLDVVDETKPKLSLPRLQEMKPESLSVLRFTMRPVTKMKFSE